VKGTGQENVATLMPRNSLFSITSRTWSSSTSMIFWLLVALEFFPLPVKRQRSQREWSQQKSDGGWTEAVAVAMVSLDNKTRVLQKMDCRKARASEEKKKRDEAFIHLQWQKTRPMWPIRRGNNTTVQFPHQHINCLTRLKWQWHTFSHEIVWLA
jgi:hypothetical protein